MKKILMIIACLFIFSTAVMAEENMRKENPNAITLELLGPAGIYSFNYDHTFAGIVGVGAGFSAFSFSGVFLAIIPMYVNLNLGPEKVSFLISAGATLVTGSFSLGGTSTGGAGAMPLIGIGFEYRSSFVFRLRFTPLIGGGGFFPWGGISFGMAF